MSQRSNYHGNDIISQGQDHQSIHLRISRPHPKHNPSVWTKGVVRLARESIGGLSRLYFTGSCSSAHQSPRSKSRYTYNISILGMVWIITLKGGLPLTKVLGLSLPLIVHVFESSYLASTSPHEANISNQTTPVQLVASLVSHSSSLSNLLSHCRKCIGRYQTVKDVRWRRCALSYD